MTKFNIQFKLYFKQLIANKKAWENTLKREKIEQIAMLLQGALLAEKLVGIKMNVPENKIQAIVTLLPSLNAPRHHKLCSRKHYHQKNRRHLRRRPRNNRRKR